MHFWSRVAQFVWQEAEAPVSAEPEPRVSSQGTGVPEYLRKAVRFAIVGLTATMLTAGIINVRLVARVDAGESYEQCIANCQNQEAMCLGTGSASCTDKLNRALAACDAQAAEQSARQHCASLIGPARQTCLNRVEATRRCCVCLARENAAKCRVNCVPQLNKCLSSCKK